MAKKTEKKYVVDTSFNWADEMDVDGFCILTQSKLDEYKELAESMKDDQTLDYYCGTNEGTEFSKEEILDMLNEAQEITPKELAVIEKFVPYRCRNADIFEQLFDDFEEGCDGEEEDEEEF